MVCVKKDGTLSSLMCFEKSAEASESGLMGGKPGRRADVGGVREREDDEIFRRIGNV